MLWDGHHLGTHGHELVPQDVLISLLWAALAGAISRIKRRGLHIIHEVLSNSVGGPFLSSGRAFFTVLAQWLLVRCVCLHVQFWRFCFNRFCFFVDLDLEVVKGCRLFLPGLWRLTIEGLLLRRWSTASKVGSLIVHHMLVRSPLRYLLPFVWRLPLALNLSRLVHFPKLPRSLWLVDLHRLLLCIKQLSILVLGKWAVCFINAIYCAFLHILKCSFLFDSDLICYCISHIC